MNKAFVREPDQTADYCPRCGSQGEQVGDAVLIAYVGEEQRRGLAKPANFCPSPHCAVAYFDSFERVVLASELTRPAYPKDPTAPLCACFGFTCQDVERDIDEGVAARTRELLEKARSPAARCAQLAANGRSCAAHVQKYYLQCRSARQGNA